MTEMSCDELVALIEGLRTDGEVPSEVADYLIGLAQDAERVKDLAASVDLDPDHQESPKHRAYLMRQLDEMLWRGIKDRGLVTYTTEGERITAVLTVLLPKVQP